MGGLVIDQVSTAVRALLDGDARLAETRACRARRRSTSSNAPIDREAFDLIALHQPMAGDLRMAKAVVAHRRSSSNASATNRRRSRASRARVGERAHPDPVRAVARYLRHMAELTAGMLRDAVRALDESDAELAARGARRATRSWTRVRGGAAPAADARDAGSALPRRDDRHGVRAQGPRAHRRPRQEHRRAGACSVHGRSAAAAER